MYESKTGVSKPRLPFWNDRIRRFDQLPQVVRDEMNWAMELVNLITEKSTEVTTICRGFVKPTNPLYREVTHDSWFHANCFAWAGRCLAYARPGSLEYVQGLQARADLHYHCGNWDECLLDAREAIDQMRRHKLKDQLGTVKRLGELLTKAKARAAEQPSRPPEPHPNMNNYEPLDVESQKPPSDGCLFDGVKPHHTAKWGRHLVATRDIKVGEMILVEDMACCVLNPEEAIHTNCSHCAAQAWRGVACDRCVYAIYCSERCRVQAWSEYHDIECQIYEVVNRRFDRVECQAALRLLVKFLKMPGSEDAMTLIDVLENNSATLHQIDPLDKGFKDHRERNKDTTSAASTLLWYNCLPDRAGNEEDAEMLLDQAGSFEFLDYDDEVDDALLGVVLASLRRNNGGSLGKGIIGDDSITKCRVRKFFRRMKRVFQVNSHWFGLLPQRNSPRSYTADLKCFALSYYSSMINHDCFNNSALVIGKGGKLMAYAVAPIKKDAQITISYSHMMNFTLNAATRRLDLAWERKFICYCQGCVEEWLPKSPTVSFEIDVVPENFFFTQRFDFCAASCQSDNAQCSLHRQDGSRVQRRLVLDKPANPQ
uniref:MYND-type domain-containing protein n=1 Tax=Trichogramma kaykai TaxID=54128 RepID=A0ABD2XMQ1_9HYME